jgi:hypothetical protein
MNRLIAQNIGRMIGFVGVSAFLLTTCQSSFNRLTIYSKTNPADFSNEIKLMSHGESLPFRVNVSILEVYEDRSPPPGSRPSADRPVGHGVMRLRLENLTQTPLNVTVLSIALSCEHSNDPQQSIMSQPVGSIELGGLQILERGFHLTNREGFTNTERVKAIVTYQFDNAVYTAESPLFPVTVNP